MGTERKKLADSPESRANLIRKLYDSTIDHDLYLDAYADDLIWYAPKGRGKLMGEHHGRAYMDQAFGYVVSSTSEFDSFIGENEILVDDYDTVSFNRDFGKRADGVPFDFQVAIRWEIEGAQVKVMTEYIQDEAHKAEFF